MHFSWFFIWPMTSVFLVHLFDVIVHNWYDVKNNCFFWHNMTFWCIYDVKIHECTLLQHFICHWLKCPKCIHASRKQRFTSDRTSQSQNLWHAKVINGIVHIHPLSPFTGLSFIPTQGALVVGPIYDWHPPKIPGSIGRVCGAEVMRSSHQPGYVGSSLASVFGILVTAWSRLLL